MINIVCGQTGQGKTLYQSSEAIRILYRNWKWYKKTGVVRRIAHNFPISEKWYQEFPGFLHRWNHLEELPELQECDIFWDEVSNGIDSNNWKDLGLDIKIFLRQHEKRGCDIYGTTQRWMSVDVNYRNLVSEMYVAKKIIGSRRPCATKPDVKHPWGIIWLEEMDPKTFASDEPKPVGGILSKLFPKLLWIGRELCDFYDTRYEIAQGQYQPLKHIERYCTDPKCKNHTQPMIHHI